VVVMIAVVIVVVPVAFGVPAVLVFIPPAVVGVPAPLAGLAEFDPSTIGLAALPAMTGGGLVEFVVGAGDAALAIVVVGLERWRGDEHQERGQSRGCKSLESES
jgi:hypothetical protein